MPNEFYIADLHLGHENLLKFKREDNVTYERPFSSLEEMHETFISNWNKVVSPMDKTYILGDVVFRRKNLVLLDRLNGRKSLVRGNHDIFSIDDYLKYFKNVHTMVEKRGMICTHVPLHPDSVTRWGVNVHGHLHRHAIDDPRYFCVSADRINFTPIEFSELTKQILVNYPEWMDRNGETPRVL